LGSEIAKRADMKVLPFKIPRTFGEPIMIQHDQQDHIYSTLHQHPELQMMLIRKSAGTVVIGGYIGEFHPGDVFVIGSNIPHVFRNEEPYYTENGNAVADVIYVFLDDKLIKNELLNFIEINSLFHIARQGLKLKGQLKSRVAPLIDNLIRVHAFDQYFGVLNILNILSKSEEFVVLNSEIIRQRIDENDGKRLNDVIQYTFERYADRITLEEISEVANMVPSAFCRFFKQRTRKTYFDFLNEIRIRNACKLLLNKDTTVVEICFKSGFNNLSYFNRKFKDVTGFSPLKYHRALKGDLSSI
jgi:AraC-like DNA-binding protein